MKISRQIESQRMAVGLLYCSSVKRLSEDQGPVHRTATRPKQNRELLSRNNQRLSSNNSSLSIRLNT